MESTLAYQGVTTIHSIGLTVLLISIISFILSSYDKKVVPLLVILAFIPSAQRVVLLTLDFNFVRIAIIVLVIILILSKDGRKSILSAPDILLFLWAIWGILAYGFLVESISGIISKAGYMIEAVGAYYIGRKLLNDFNSIKQAILILGWLAFASVFIFMIEYSTGKNMFYVFGGVSENTVIREGKLRCQGPFLHPIMAGVFWASMTPLFIAMFFNQKIKKHLLLLFFISAVIIVFVTASSTPVMALIIGLVGIWLYRTRRKLSLIRGSVLIMLVILHFVMNQPIWHLLARIDVVGGSTGWHRYHLIDRAIAHFNEWWLVGTLSTAHWGIGLEDVTNQYIFEGVTAGVLGTLFYIFFIWRVFCAIGQGLAGSKDKARYWLLWGLGVVLFVHSITFLSVTYFGQNVAAFFLIVGATVSLAIGQPSLKENSNRAKAESHDDVHVDVKNAY